MVSMNTPQNVPASLHQTTDPWAVPTKASLELIATGPTEVKPADTITVANPLGCAICGARNEPCPPGAIHR
jgi:hypothetical protein